MGRHQYAKDVKVTVTQGQRKSYYDHDNRDSSNHRGNSRGSANRVWRRGDRRVSFNDKRGGISKGGRGGGHHHKKFNQNAVGALLEGDEDMRGPSIQRGRARPASRAITRKFRGTVGSLDRNRFVKLAPLSDDNKKLIQEAMNKHYNAENKALDLANFGADSTFGGSSGATGKMTDDRVVEAVLETIKAHLPDLNALNLSNNQLRSLRAFEKLADSAPNITILFLDKNRLAHTKELDFVSRLRLVHLKLDDNSLVGNFRDGSHYRSIMQRKFKTLRHLDGVELPPVITFEEDNSASTGPSSIQIPRQPKMCVNDQIGDMIGRFLQLYFKIYDSDNREELGNAYHAEAMMSMSASFIKSIQDETVSKHYIPESRNLQMDFVQKNPGKRDRMLHLRKSQIVGFLDKLPKTQHDLDTFTLDIPFAMESLATFTVTGMYRERSEGKSCPIKQFSRMFVVIPFGEGLVIVNDTLYVTHATKIPEKTNSLFMMAEKSGMNTEWSKQCLEAQNWDLDQALQAFDSAKREGKIPQEAFVH